MVLDATQRAQFRNWLVAKQVRATCPACGATNQWEAEQAVAVPRMEADGVHIDSQLAPIIQVTCHQCAYVLLFAATPMGIRVKKRQLA